MTKKNYILITFGTFGVFAYLLHIVLGDFLLESHNPITMTIANITAQKTPYAFLLKGFIWLFALFMILFSIGMYNISKLSYQPYIPKIWIGVFLPSQIIFFIDSIFIHTNLHGVLLSIYTVLLLTVLITISISYFNYPQTKKFGVTMLFLIFIILIFAIYYFINAFYDYHTVGLAERLFVFAIMTAIFSISNYEAFNDKHTELS